MVCLYKQAIRWIKSHVDDQAQRINVSWDLPHPEASAKNEISQRFTLGSALFNILISGEEGPPGCMLLSLQITPNSLIRLRAGLSSKGT